MEILLLETCCCFFQEEDVNVLDNEEKTRNTSHPFTSESQSFNVTEQSDNSKFRLPISSFTFNKQFTIKHAALFIKLKQTHFLSLFFVVSLSSFSLPFSSILISTFFASVGAD